MEIDLLEEAKKRPFAEKMQLVEDLWDAIAEEAAQRPLSPAQKKLLDARMKAHQANPNRGRPAEEVLREIEQRL
ncbi:MAG: addiction module protein [Thiobacillus sp.]|nr:addiction module protein [Thiobacillus sp.]MDP2979389.1 addiction module protein [Thiobacillus sp.]